MLLIRVNEEEFTNEKDPVVNWQFICQWREATETHRLITSVLPEDFSQALLDGNDLGMN